MLVKSFEYASQCGYQDVLVNVLKDNKRARKFYEYMGGRLIQNSETTFTIDQQNYQEVKYRWDIRHAAP